MHVIWRAEKITKKQTAGERRHHKDRMHIIGREHPEREKYNQSWEKDGRTLYDHAKEIEENHRKTTGRKAKSTAIVMISHMMTASPEASEEILKNKSKWIEEQLEYCRTTSPGEILAWYYEEDERTPHIHIYQSAADEEGRLNINRTGIFAGASKMQALQEAYEMHMRYANIFQNIESRTKQEDRPKGEKKKHTSAKLYREIEEQIKNEMKLKEAQKTIEEIFKE